MSVEQKLNLIFDTSKMPIGPLHTLITGLTDLGRFGVRLVWQGHSVEICGLSRKLTAHLRDGCIDALEHMPDDEIVACGLDIEEGESHDNLL